MLFYFGRMSVVFFLTPVSSTCNLAEKCLFETEETFQDCSPGNHRVFIFFKSISLYFYIWDSDRLPLFGTFEGGYFFQEQHTWAKAKEAIILQDT